MDSPMIAIVHPDTLAGLGLASILERIMPMAAPSVFASVREMEEAGTTEFFHYFVAAEVLLSEAAFFLERKRKTIVLVQGAESNRIPRDLHTLDCRQPEEQLTHTLIRLAGMAHGKHSAHPTVAQVQKPAPASKMAELTQREVDVLRLITRGYINKEIADRLNVSLPTVVTHRKNLTDKLGTRSVSALTVFALTHGIIKIEEI